MLKEKEYRLKHQIKLYYGYQVAEDCEIYHSFEATDPTVSTVDDEMAKHLADLLDTEPDDEAFDYQSMYIHLPETVVDRIKAEGVQEYLDGRK